MDFASYSAAVLAAAQLHENGRPEEALAGFERLANDFTLGDLDRTIMWINVATVRRALRLDTRVIEDAYDRGIALERPWHRGRAREEKIEWLHKIGRHRDALAMLDSLLVERWLDAAERDRLGRARAELSSDLATS